MKLNVLTFSCGLACAIWLSSLTPCGAQEGDLLKMVVELLGEKDKDLRAVAFEQVRTVNKQDGAKGEAATKLFASQLAKITPTAQVGLLSALADRGDGAARPAVLELLNQSQDEAVRVAAIGALGPLGAGSELPLLLKIIAGPSAPERAAAIASLSRLRGEQVNAGIVQGLKPAEPNVAADLIKILATRRAVECVPDLLQASEHRSAVVRSAAMTTLAELAEVKVIPELLRGVLKAEPGEERDAAEKAVAAVCGNIAPVNERVLPILASLAKYSEAEQLELLPLVGRVGGTPALQLIETSLKSSNPARSEAAWKVLGKWPDSSISDKLWELTKTAPTAEHRSLALKAFVRVSSMRDARSDLERLNRLKQAMTLAANVEEKNLILTRCRTAYSIETLRYVLPYLDQAASTQAACETVVELAHHREIREPHKAEFDPALDRVMKLSTAAVVRERAKLYKAGQTWSKPSSK